MKFILTKIYFRIIEILKETPPSLHSNNNIYSYERIANSVNKLINLRSSLPIDIESINELKETIKKENNNLKQLKKETLINQNDIE